MVKVRQPIRSATCRKGGDGVDSLVERRGFRPIPYHGRYAMANSYWLEPAREPLRDAVIEFLGHELKGERVPVDSFAYEHPVRIDGQVINVAYGGSGQYVSVSLPQGATDRRLLETVARRLDELLATGNLRLNVREMMAVRQPVGGVKR